jgi:peptide-methionine (S)-S-oxide reductase
MEAVYKELRGVDSVVSGYMGGHAERPSYQEVCGGDTGHAEVIQLVFDPAVIGYRDILEVFFSTHDPTTLNRQGNDVGTQYRSVIFWNDEAQKSTAAAMIEELSHSGKYRDPIVTELVRASNFWAAEDYHRDYLRYHPNEPYCAYVVRPKVEKFRAHFGSLRKPG